MNYYEGTGENKAWIKSWMVFAFVIFQIFFMVVNEGERLRIAEETKKLDYKVGDLYTRQVAHENQVHRYFVAYENHVHRYYDGKIKKTH